MTFINGASAAQDVTLREPAENFFRFNADSMQWIAGLGRYAYEEKDIRSIVSVAEDYSLPYTQLMGFMLDYCALGGAGAGPALGLHRRGGRRAHRRNRVRYGDGRAVPGIGAPRGEDPFSKPTPRPAVRLPS